MKVEKECPACKNLFISEKRQRRKFCNSSCAAIYNNKLRSRGSEKNCLNCGEQFKGKHLAQKYCSRECMGNHKSKENYIKITKGLVTKNANYSGTSLKPYILKEQYNKCAICSISDSWNNKPIVFILDHINGNASDNTRINLRLICPNCDSQLDTYKAKNKGKGRKYRMNKIREHNLID